jgi:hypothetical protein
MPKHTHLNALLRQQISLLLLLQLDSLLVLMMAFRRVVYIRLLVFF